MGHAVSPRNRPPDGRAVSGRDIPSARVLTDTGRRDSRGKFRSEKWDFSTRNLLLAARRSPLRKDVRKPAGFPTPFGWAYPVLAGAVDWSGRRASAIWGRALPFPLPPSQSGGLRPSRHPSGRAYPVLVGAVDWSGRKPSAVRRVSIANLEVERLSFSSISRPKHRSSSKSWFGAEKGEWLCPSPRP